MRPPGAVIRPVSATSAPLPPVSEQPVSGGAGDSAADTVETGETAPARHASLPTSYAQGNSDIETFQMFTVNQIFGHHLKMPPSVVLSCLSLTMSQLNSVYSPIPKFIFMNSRQPLQLVHISLISTNYNINVAGVLSTRCCLLFGMFRVQPV